MNTKINNSVLPMHPEALILNEIVKCPNCLSRNLTCFISSKSIELIHFNDGIFNLKEKKSSSENSSISFECKDCQNVFNDELVQDKTEILK